MKINDLESRPLRSQPTRDRILEAARVIFGRDGYDHATIRGIAARGEHQSGDGDALLPQQGNFVRRGRQLQDEYIGLCLTCPSPAWVRPSCAEFREELGKPRSRSQSPRGAP